jgi:hypothetical protein
MPGSPNLVPAWSSPILRPLEREVESDARPSELLGAVVSD